MSDKTAILFFSRTLKDEFDSKSFGIGLKRFARLYSLLKGKTLSEAHATGLRVVESYSDTHKGSSFAEKLVHELETMKKDGFQHVVVIGNDTPELNSEDILIAADYLKQGDNVIGRDRRGGAFLIGLNLKSFDLSDLLDISWQTGSLALELGNTLKARFLNKNVQDINASYDLSEFSRKRSSLSPGFLRLLKSILTLDIDTRWEPRIKASLEGYKLTILRGPPQLSILA